MNGGGGGKKVKSFQTKTMFRGEGGGRWRDLFLLLWPCERKINQPEIIEDFFSKNQSVSVSSYNYYYARDDSDHGGYYYVG